MESQKRLPAEIAVDQIFGVPDGGPPHEQRFANFVITEIVEGDDKFSLKADWVSGRWGGRDTEINVLIPYLKIMGKTNPPIVCLQDYLVNEL